MSLGARLIAEREFRTYVGTLSFWLALFLGPLLTAGVFELGMAAKNGGPIAITIHAGNSSLDHSVSDALTEAGGMEGKRFVRTTNNGHATLTLSLGGDRSVAMQFSDGFPLSAEGRLLVERSVERDSARGEPHDVAREAALLVNKADRSTPGGSEPARFVTVAILWLTLTGSLGMLLQAVVRERANRALEGLLAAARPWEIMAGKLVGIGAVSVLILGAWLGSLAAFSAWAPSNDGEVAQVLASLAAPGALTRAALIYLLAYAFYGCVTFGLGAAARDVAAAQNMSRPMFAVLLMACFVALACAFGARESWLLYLPPFAPFLLLMHSPAELPLVSQMESIGCLVLGTLAAGWLAVGRLSVHNVWVARSTQA
jgi:ABC-2 type transport system permease protein